MGLSSATKRGVPAIWLILQQEGPLQRCGALADALVDDIQRARRSGAALAAPGPLATCEL